MAVIRICAEEVTATAPTFNQDMTCGNPDHPPVGPGTQSNVAVYNMALNLAASPPQICFSYDVELEYQYLNQGVTFMEFCHMNGNSTCLDLPDGLTLCTCGITPSYTASPSSSVLSATPTSVTGSVQIDFSIDDLCVPTSFCIDTVTCPI